MSNEHDHIHDHVHLDPPAHGPEGGGLPGVAADPAQESLVRALRASFNILRVLMVVLVILYVFSGVFRVEPGQQGLIARLGELRYNRDTGSYVFPPGWHRALPDPFDRKYVVTGLVQTLKVTTFMFAHPEAATAKDLSTIVVQSRELQPGVDGAMLTGDKNLSHGRWEVQYRIDDAGSFVQNVADTPEAFEPLLERLTQTAVVREVASRTVEEVTRNALDSVRLGVERRLQQGLDELQCGVKVVQVVAYTIEPGAVRDAFLDVSRAESERLTLEREAETSAAETLNRAAGSWNVPLLALIREYGAAQLRGAPEDELAANRAAIDGKLLEAADREAGQVAVRLRNARASANEINDQLRAEYQTFVGYLAQRAVRPGITELGLWKQMREEILGDRANEVFFLPMSDQIEILVNRDPQRQVELEERRTLQRQKGERGQQ